MITGSVNSGGTVAAGTGFSSLRTAAGRYTLTFSPVFAAAPVVLVDAVATTGNETVTINTASTATVQVNINTGGVAEDTPFVFAAIAVH